MKAFKLFNVRKNGTIGPLFINRPQIVPIGIWLSAEPHRTKRFKFRPGWHVTERPYAPHLTMKHRAWYEVEIKDYIELMRPASQGGKWFVAQQMKVLRAI